MFGAYDLSDLFQTGSLSGSPAEIFIHPDWNPFNIRYDADIAAIVIDEEVPFTKYIRPICLSSTSLNSREGYVAGWGESEDKNKVHENLPSRLKSRSSRTTSASSKAQNFQESHRDERFAAELATCPDRAEATPAADFSCDKEALTS